MPGTVLSQAIFCKRTLSGHLLQEEIACASFCLNINHQGAAAYREEFDLLYRRESPHANAMWQADHTPLDVLLFNETGTPAKPWLTVIEDDYSRAIAGYRLSFQEATALTTALTLRQAIWHKDDPRWQICGIPTVFYTDHGSDFTSKHLVLVATAQV